MRDTVYFTLPIWPVITVASFALNIFYGGRDNEEMFPFSLVI